DARHNGLYALDSEENSPRADPYIHGGRPEGVTRALANALARISPSAGDRSASGDLPGSPPGSLRNQIGSSYGGVVRGARVRFLTVPPSRQTAFAAEKYLDKTLRLGARSLSGCGIGVLES